MTQLEKTKFEAIEPLKRLCSRCKDKVEHDCRVNSLIREIESLHGVPIIVNDSLYHVMFS